MARRKVSLWLRGNVKINRENCDYQNTVALQSCFKSAITTRQNIHTSHVTRHTPPNSNSPKHIAHKRTDAGPDVAILVLEQNAQAVQDIAILMRGGSQCADAIMGQPPHCPSLVTRHTSPITHHHVLATLDNARPMRARYSTASAAPQQLLRPLADPPPVAVRCHQTPGSMTRTLCAGHCC